MAEKLKKLTSRVQGVEGGKGIESLNYKYLCTQLDVELPEGYKPPKFEMFYGTGDPKGIKSGIVINFEALQATNKALQSGSISKKKKVRIVMVAQGPKTPLIYQIPPPTHQPSPPRYSQPTAAYHTYNSQPYYFQSPPTRPNYQKPRPNFDRKPPKQYTTIAETIDQLYERLKDAGYVTPIPALAMENSSQWVNPNKTCAYHYGMKGHTIDECRTLKNKIQTLIDNKAIQAKKAAPNIRNNPLPYHRGERINVIETDEEWDPEGSIGLIKEGDDPKKPAVTLNPIVVQIQPLVEVEVTASVPFEVEVTPPATVPIPFEVKVATPVTVIVATTPPFNSNAIPWDYVAEARRKGKAKMEESGAAQGITRTGRIYTPKNLGRLIKEAATKQLFIETGPDNLWRKVQVLNEAYVPNNITSGEMSNMVGQVLESHKITFHEDELPPEGLSHNRALYITVQLEDKYIASILIDGGFKP
ncbi:uncharacterized protein [Nicotiana sylvestris]|uniref:uncharacterized protein n=1 Tax=Nicotiana sylvestris TaxID=4096 RepID=UPI00388C4D7B